MLQPILKGKKAKTKNGWFIQAGDTFFYCNDDMTERHAWKKTIENGWLPTTKEWAFLKSIVPADQIFELTPDDLVKVNAILATMGPINAIYWLTPSEQIMRRKYLEGRGTEILPRLPLKIQKKAIETPKSKAPWTKKVQPANQTGKVKTIIVADKKNATANAGSKRPTSFGALVLATIDKSKFTD